MQLQKALLIAAVAAAAVVAAGAPSQADELSRAVDKFCVSVRQNMNSKGIAAAPGSPAAALVAKIAKQTPAKYATLWAIAKGTNNSNCQRMY